MVIPGGRSALVSHKLSRNPLWQRTAEEAGWRFIKYRHVRKLADQSDINEYALQTIIGLDPIVDPSEGAWIATHTDRGRHEILPGTGHLAILARPDLIVARAERFLADWGLGSG